MSPVHRLLRAATIALAFVFALPSCFTVLLWQRDPSYPRKATEVAPELTAHRLEDGGGKIAFHLSPDAAARLRDNWPAGPVITDWLVVTPREHAATIEALLRTPGTEPRVSVNLEDPVNGDFGRIVLTVSTLHGEELESLPGMQPFSHSQGAQPCYFVHVSCEIAAPDRALTGLGTELTNAELSLLQIDTNGKPVLLRLAATPFVLLLDVVLLPLELIGMLLLFR